LLPRVIQENTIQPFKFWLSGSLQDGVHFHNELYYRLKQAPADARGQLYQLGCRLVQHGADVFLSVSDENCSLWANLRNQKVAASAISDKLSLPTAEMLLQ